MLQISNLFHRKLQSKIIIAAARTAF